MPNGFHRFTVKAQEALQNAQEIAAQKSHGELKAAHLLSALIHDQQSPVPPLLLRSGINLEKLHDEIERNIETIPKIVSGGNVSQLYLSQELIQILEKAAKFALAQKDLELRGAGQVYGQDQSGFYNFKMADLSDLDFIAEIKKTAIKFVAENDLSDFPLLKEKLSALGLLDHLE